MIFCEPPPRSRVGLMVDRSELVGALPGDMDLAVALVGVHNGGEPGAVAIGGPVDGAAQHVVDAVERHRSAIAGVYVTERAPEARGVQASPLHRCRLSKPTTVPTERRPG